MNERIKEPYYSLMYKASEGWNDHLFQVPPELLEKFAELIVQECIRIVARRKDQAVDDGCNVDEAMSVAEMDLEEHFGVNE